VNPTLQGYSAAIFSALGDDRAAAQGLAADLSAIDRLVHDNAPLRLAVTDTALPGPQRKAILAELLADKVSEPARKLASFAAGAVRAPEVPSAVNWLATEAERAVEGRDEEEAALSYTAARRRVGGFAAALFEDLSTAELEEMEDELFRFARTVESTPPLRNALTNPDLPPQVRADVVDALLGGKVQPATVRLVRYAVFGGRTRDIVGTLDWLVEETARARGWRVARVRAGDEVGDEQRGRLSDSLSALTGSPVELQVSIDRTLLGGVIIEVGDLLVDATARGRLEGLREHLLPTGWHEGGFGRQVPGTHPEGAS
jgi:F-type H+-transporting ATPase subunit delta